MKMCQQRTEVYSRIVGLYRPVQQWNLGKQEEYKDRKKAKVRWIKRLPLVSLEK